MAQMYGFSRFSFERNSNNRALRINTPHPAPGKGEILCSICLITALFLFRYAEFIFNFGYVNGSVVIELEQSQVRVIGKPIPPDQCEPISREEQARNMSEFLTEIARSLARQRKAG